MKSVIVIDHQKEIGALATLLALNGLTSCSAELIVCDDLEEGKKRFEPSNIKLKAQHELYIPDSATRPYIPHDRGVIPDKYKTKHQRKRH